ncbi:MAG TPA: hypothetical protein VFQ30_09000 [Ktedonobacteraceae bacterium]|nr:hypothetical protein [Ktedonobacteraceae bacterium]
MDCNHEQGRLARVATRLEARFAANLHSGSRRGPQTICRVGSLPLLISAPHAVNHPRDGNVKLADTYTGPFSLQVAKIIHASVLVYARTSAEDPNYDPDGPYKRQLSELANATHAQLVVDIHGMALSRPAEMVIGTAGGKTLGKHGDILTVFESILRQHAIRDILIDDPYLFNASYEHTITSYTWNRLKIPAMQIEIRKDLRNPDMNPCQYVQAVTAISEGLMAIAVLL